MEIKTGKTQGKWLELAVSGRVDSLTAAEFESACRAAIQQGAVWIAVNFGEVNFLSSAGLRALLTLHKFAKAQSGGLILVAPQPNVQEVLEVSGFNQILPLAPTLADLPT